MPLLDELQGTNERISSWLARLSSSRSTASVPGPETIAGLLSELLHAGTWLRQEWLSAAETDAALSAEIDTYRQHIERLHQLLPSLHRSLLAEQARIEAERSRIRSAAEWARGSRQAF